MRNILNYQIIRSIDDKPEEGLYVVKDMETNRRFALKKIPLNNSNPLYNKAIQEFDNLKIKGERIDSLLASPVIADTVTEQNETYLLLKYINESLLKRIGSYPSIGKILNNRYIAVKGISYGGFGTVYLIRDLNLPGKYWALKEMHERDEAPKTWREASGLKLKCYQGWITLIFLEYRTFLLKIINSIW